MFMKTNIWKSAAAFVLGFAAVVACQDDVEEIVLPIFPDKVVEKNVEAGETVELTFNANVDWEVSIPASEQNKYWLDDEGIPASKVSGKAGDQTVSVVFSEDEYYDANVVCEVTLTMGGESKVIAKLSRLALNRTLEVYTAEKGDWSFKKTYNATKAESILLETFEGNVTYSMPIKVVANYDWNLVLPEWCKGEIKVAEGEAASETLSGKSGAEVELVLTAVLSDAVKDGAESELTFLDAAVADKDIKLPIALPAFSDRIEVSAPATLDFSADGTSASPSISYVLAMKGFVVRALGFNGEWHDTSYADWVTAEVQYDDSESASVLCNSAVIFGMTENTGKERVADVFVFPASMATVEATAICDENSPTCGFKAEYEKYYLGRFVQAGVAGPYITEYTDPMMGIETYEASLSTYQSSQWWAPAGLAANNQYELIYSHPEWSELTMQFDTPFSSYKIFDYDFIEVSEAAQENFWLTFIGMAQNTRGKVSMNPALFNNPNAAAPESFIVFYDENGKALAGVCCKFTSTSGGDSSAPISVKSGSAEVMNDLSSMGLPAGTLNNIISGLGAGTAQTEMMIMASTSEVEFTTNFSFTNIFVLDLQGNMTTPEGFSCYQSSYTDFKVTAASGTECLLLFMDQNGGLPVVVYYTCYY